MPIQLQPYQLLKLEPATLGALVLDSTTPESLGRALALLLVKKDQWNNKNFVENGEEILRAMLGDGWEARQILEGLEKKNSTKAVADKKAAARAAKSRQRLLTKPAKQSPKPPPAKPKPKPKAKAAAKPAWGALDNGAAAPAMGGV